jgi:hypothetical protein
MLKSVITKIIVVKQHNEPNCTTNITKKLNNLFGEINNMLSKF